MASSPCNPQAQGRAGAQQRDAALRPTDAVNQPVNTLTEQLLSCTISKPKHKREQTSATPASQARPRTQRRTAPDGQESIPAPAAAASAQREENVTPSRLNCLSELQVELSCAVCLEICVRPCATPCGHAFCRSCLRQALQVKRQCPKCRATLPPPSSWQPKVNTALWNTIQLLFPRHAAQAQPPTPEVQAAAANSRTRTAAGSNQLRHRHVADVLSTSSAAGVFTSDAAVRRGFRPPRPADAVQAGRLTRHTRQQQQQQQIDQFVMPADLGSMLQDMYRTGSGSGASRIARNTRSQTAAQPSQASTHQQQHLESQGSNPFARGQRQTVVLETDSDNDNSIDWEQFDFSILDNPASQQRHHQQQSIAQSGSQWQAVQRDNRQQARRAAAARVHAAIAEDLQGSSTAAGGYNDDDDETLRAAILASLHDAEAPAAASTAAAAAGPSRAAAANSRPVVQQRGCRQRQQPSRERSASLFGLVHSGRSPQQQWAVHSDDEDVQLDEDWLLEDFGSDPAERSGGAAAAASRGSSTGLRVSRDRAAAAAGPNHGVLGVMDQGYGVQMHAELHSRCRRIAGPGTASTAVVAAAADPAGPAAAVAHDDAEQGRLVHEAWNAHARRRCPGRRVIMSGSESPESDDEVHEPAAGIHHPPAAGLAQTAAAGISASGMADRQQGVAAGQTAAQQRSTEATAPVAVNEPLDVSVLSLAPSPEPQPLAARLARFRSHPQQQQQQAGVRGSSLHQAPGINTAIMKQFGRIELALSSAGPSSSSITSAAAPSQVQGLRSRLVNSSSSSRNDDSRIGPASLSAASGDRPSQPAAPPARLHVDTGADNESSDDFEPASQLSGRRMTAARAVAASTSGSSTGLARGAASGGRVVSGLRRGDHGRQRRSGK